jgi:hypothetical protein
MVRITVTTLSPVSDDIWVYHVEITESDGSDCYNILLI